ncbi:MAG: S-methyl-5'-thioadenosine phosphorylase [Polyangiaceae bacterium]
MTHVLGVIGGSGLYAIEGVTELEELKVSTPYGSPSDPVTRGRIGDTSVLFLPRHGNGHRISPSEINYRANICALKMLGATQVISISAVGSLRESICPGDVVIVDQYIDRTYRRVGTFFEGGMVAHVSLADPTCPQLAAAARSAAATAGATVHGRGTYVCIEGPQFSTRAESKVYRSFDADVIGMTAMPEARLAREAELPYVTVAFATDYDCWHQSEEDVTVEQVLAVLKKNGSLARRLIVELAKCLPDPSESIAYRALKDAIMTNQAATSPEARTRLAWLLDARH